MSTTPDTTAFDRGVSSFLQIFLPEKAQQVVEFKADLELQDRIEELANKSTEDELSDEERAEYQGYVRANKFIAVFQRKARQALSDNSSGE